jgi:hypothetical protein
VSKALKETHVHENDIGFLLVLIFFCDLLLLAVRGGAVSATEARMCQEVDTWVLEQ